MRRIGIIFLLMFFIIITSYNITQGSYSLEPPEGSALSSEGYLFTEVVGDLLTVDIRDVALEEVLKQIAAQNGIKFFLSPSLGEEKVMVRFSNFKIDDGLNKILAPYNRIFIYSEEDHNSHQPPITRLIEVRIYSRFHKGNKEGRLEVASVINPKVSQPSLKNKDKGTKRYETKESDGSKGRKSVEALSRDLKGRDPRMKKTVKELARMGNKKATGPLALEDKNPEVRKEAEKALEKKGEALREENEYDSQTDADGEEPLPSEGGDPSFAIEYSNDFPEQGNQGVDVDIRLNDVSEKLLSAGFWINYDPSKVDILSADVYDGSALSGPWDRGMTKKVPDAGGPGTYMVTCGNLANVSPDGNSDINIAKIRFLCKGKCDTPITISTISGFDTVVGGNNGYVYDPNINPTTVTIP